MRYLLSFFVGVLLSASLYAQSAGDKDHHFPFMPDRHGTWGALWELLIGQIPIAVTYEKV